MKISRRQMLILLPAEAVAWESVMAGTPEDAPNYKMTDHWWGMLIDIPKCIGCGNCVRACQTENDVPNGYFRTWVERYHVSDENMTEPEVISPDGGKEGFPVAQQAGDVDQDGVEQLRELPRVGLQDLHVALVVVDADGLHPLEDAPGQAGSLVPAEVEVPPLVHVVEQRLQLAVFRRSRHRLLHRGTCYYLSRSSAVSGRAVRRARQRYGPAAPPLVRRTEDQPH